MTGWQVACLCSLQETNWPLFTALQDDKALTMNITNHGLLPAVYALLSVRLLAALSLSLYLSLSLLSLSLHLSLNFLPSPPAEGRCSGPQPTGLFASMQCPTHHRYNHCLTSYHMTPCLLPIGCSITGKPLA